MTGLPPEGLTINVADVVNVNIQPGTGHIGIEGAEARVVLSEAQRSLLKRVLEKVLSALYAVEVIAEVSPDGTIRVFGRLRS